MRGALAGRLVRRLVDAGLVGLGDAMAGEVSVVDLSRSNVVSLVMVGGRARAVVKHARVSADGMDPYEAELAAYRWLGATPATAGVAPALVLDLAGERAIVVEPVEGAACLHEVVPAAGELLVTLGQVLGTLHAAPVGRRLVARRPWVLGVADGDVPAMLAGNAAAAGVIDRIRSVPRLCDAIAELAGDWTARAPMHGDVKFDNVLVGPGEGQVRLVDWELAGLGEPAWDLAGVADGVVMPGLVQGAGGPWSFAAVLVALAPALEAHRATAGPRLAPAPRLLQVAIVARLAQTAVQLAAMGDQRPETVDASGRVLAGAVELAEELALLAPSCSA